MLIIVSVLVAAVTQMVLGCGAPPSARVERGAGKTVSATPAPRAVMVEGEITQE